MINEIQGQPFWEIRFDENGHPDPATTGTLPQQVMARNITDLIIFAHGWNNDETIALQLYQGFFNPLTEQLQKAPAGTVIGLIGVVWPSQLWSDEPIPDFTPAAAPAGNTPGAADFSLAAAQPLPPADPSLDQATTQQLHALFPAAAAPLEKMTALLSSPPTEQAQTDFLQHLKDFSAAAGDAGDDGENAVTPTGAPMLTDSTAPHLFQTYRQVLTDAGVRFTAAPVGGQAGLLDDLSGILNGAKEALRQTTYWQMKARAGTVGRAGLGPLIGQLHATCPTLKIHLIGHSFGARLVSYALAGIPALHGPSPIKAVTLLEGAFSHNAFSDSFPFTADGKGDLAGQLLLIDGPLTACYSTFDGALANLYPLASFAANQATSAFHVDQQQWGAIGADGAQGPVQGANVTTAPIGDVGVAYPFTPSRALNIDASRIVCRGNPPSGAHSDIVHPELLWVVLTAGRIVTPS